MRRKKGSDAPLASDGARLCNDGDSGRESRSGNTSEIAAAAAVGVCSTLTDRDSPDYDLTGRRLAVVFNNKTFLEKSLNVRHGTDEDCDAIKATFDRLGFEVMIHDDPKKCDISKVIADLQREEGVSILVVIILSHGEEEGVLHAQDEQYKLDQDVVGELIPPSCQNLAGKPKVFVIQACQGKATDRGCDVGSVVGARAADSTDSPSSEENNNGSSSFRLPTHCDLLLVQASYHGHVAFRESTTGTWLVQALCQALDESEEDDELSSILKKVKRTVASNESCSPGHPEYDRKKQVPLTQDTLLRNIFLKKNLGGSHEEAGRDRRRKKRLSEANGAEEKTKKRGLGCVIDRSQ